MNKSTPKNKAAGGPAVFRFKARIFQRPQAGATDPQTLLNIPRELSTELGGLTRIEGTINGQPFRAALEADASGGHALRVNRAMLKGAGADAGDTVKLAVLGPEPEPTVPADLRAAFNTAPAAKTVWKELTTMGRRDWIRWIELAKTPETRTRRIRRTAEQLAEGKNRACCVNVYEYMLNRVEETADEVV